MERKTLKIDKKYRGYIRYYPVNPSANIKAIDCLFIPKFQKGAKLIEMRDNTNNKAKRRVVV